MSTATVTTPRAKALGLSWKTALACLATGRHAEALEAVRHAARRGETGDAVAAALLECEALLGLRLYTDASAAAARGLRRGIADPDARARLRVARGLALWFLGRTSPGRAEVLKASLEAAAPMTQARVAEALALFAWKQDRDLVEARRQLAIAQRLYGESGSDAGLVRCLGTEAGLLRDEGRFGEALKVHAGRIAIASTTTRLDAVARAYDDRGDLLAYLGRWEEARLDLTRAAELFRTIASPRAGAPQPGTAMLELAQGDLTAVRAAVDRSEAAGVDNRDDPRTRGEHWLLASDLHLAAGEAAAAEAAGSEALRLFRLVKDPAGECRGRVRRIHALLDQGRSPEAVIEGRRAVRLAARSPLGLEALAWLALGRALLHAGSREAAPAFERARSGAGGRRWMEVAARLGGALARGGGPQDAEVENALAELERWGDRRILAYGLKDIQALRGDAAPFAPGAPSSSPGSRACSAARSLAAALETLNGEGPWPARWAAVMGGLRPQVAWCRAAWVGRSGLLFTGDGGEPAPLPDTDIARALAPGSTHPQVVHLGGPGGWGRHPNVALHDLAWAAVLPVADGARLYVDGRRGAPPIDAAGLGLLELVARLLARFHGAAAEPPQAPRAAFPEIVGRSAAMERLFDEMARVAASDLFIHVFGETGTGKERVARALHAHSPRRHRPFVAVNASSLSDELFESEMFGHVRGAFTGAVADRRGYVVEADRGTLFIDEVTDLSPKGQSKLLRFLTDREFRRLGESETRRADVRILTAANASLAERVSAGAFREDLMYRLNGLTLRIPALRERGDDVLLLARYFLAARRSGGRATLPTGVAVILARYAWPGNVRQLENEMGRLDTLSGGGPLRVEHLSPGLVSRPPASPGSLAEAVTACEHAAIVQGLTLHGGNRSRTADTLGISRQALLAKMQRYGI